MKFSRKPTYLKNQILEFLKATTLFKYALSVLNMEIATILMLCHF